MSYLLKKAKHLVKGSYPDKKKFQRLSYSQCGEDCIIDFIFKMLKIDKPSYLDVGAHHPFLYNNTFLFYERGCTGVNIEPDPFLFEAFDLTRPKDINLNIGIGFKKETEMADFYVMSTRTLNTFSKSDADRYQKNGTYKIENVKQIPLVSINQIIEEKFNKGYPNFISIDVEGLDFEILNHLDFSKYRPEVLCVETLTFTEDNSEQKITRIIDYVCSQDYLVYADTNINTIFVDRKCWLSKKK